MSEERRHYPGHLPLAAGRSISLEPRNCGVMQVAAGSLVVADRLLGPGDKLQLWRGDSVQLVNIAHQATAFFAWDACNEQPSLAKRVAHGFARFARFVNGNRHAELDRCGEGTWCVQA